jgi:RNA polymerase sigma-70 factor (ECF subfamily)
MRTLVDRLTPIIQARVARALLVRRPPGSGRNVQQEVGDLTQDVFLSLFTDGARTLRSWAPERALSLENFVGLVAQRQACSLLRTGKTSPFATEPEELATLDRLAPPAAAPEAVVASREQLALLLDRLRESLSPRGLELFYRLLVYEEPVEQVRAATGMSADAVYSWRNRVGRLLRRFAAELE